ncbi:hypothetical protein IscW_ISCW001166, partial [Ixodes scapularis]
KSFGTNVTTFNVNELNTVDDKDALPKLQHIASTTDVATTVNKTENMSGNNSYDGDADKFYDDDLDDMDGFYYDNIPAQEDHGIPDAHFQDSSLLHVAQQPETPNNNTTLTSTGRDMPTKADTSNLELPEKVLSSERAPWTESVLSTEGSTTGTTTPT